jgi:putative membrane protein
VKKLVMLTAIYWTLPLAALAQTMGSTGAALSAQDKSFVQQAAYAGLAEISDGKLAETQGDAAIRELGARMVADHSKVNDRLAALSQQLGDPAPKMTDPTHQDQHAALETQTGGAFDTQYLHNERAGHEEAIKLFQTEASSGRNPELKSFAAKTLPTLEMHLSLVKSAIKAKNS